MGSPLTFITPVHVLATLYLLTSTALPWEKKQENLEGLLVWGTQALFFPWGKYDCNMSEWRLKSWLDIVSWIISSIWNCVNKGGKYIINLSSHFKGVVGLVGWFFNVKLLIIYQMLVNLVKKSILSVTIWHQKYYRSAETIFQKNLNKRFPPCWHCTNS